MTAAITASGRCVEAVRLRPLLAFTGIVAFVVRLPYLVGPVDGRTQPDSGIYVGMLNDLLNGRGFATGAEFRTPGYPLLMAPLSLLPGRVETAVVAFQHVLGVVFTIVLVWAAWRWFGRGAAILAAAVAAFSPALVNLEGDVLPDFVVGVVAFCGALLLARALERDRPSLAWAAAAGVVFGLAALVKPVAQVLVLAAVVPILVDPRRARRGVIASAVVAVAMLVTVSPWLVRNAVRYGDVRMSNQDGPNLWLREFDYDKRPFAIDTPRGRLARRLYVTGGGGRPGTTLTYQTVFGALVRDHGYSYHEAASFQRAVALGAIRDDPIAYAAGTLTIGLRLAWDVHTLAQARAGLAQKTAAAPPALPTVLSRAAFDVDQALVAFFLVASVGLVSSFVAFRDRDRRRRAAALSFATVWFALTLAVAAAGVPDSRYATSIVAMLWILGAAGASSVLVAAVRSVRMRI